MRLTEAELSAHKGRASTTPAVKTRAKPYKLTRYEPKEAAIQHAILRALRVHPAVVWHARINSAAGRLLYPNGTTSQWMQFGWKGCPDIVAGLTNGKTAFIEVKRPSGRVSPDQAAFIATENKRGGVAFVARSVADIWEVLDGIQK